MDASSSLKRLAIVGNGFDLAHGYNTTYGDFIRDIGDDFFAKYREMLCLYCESDDNWNEFENRVLDFVGGIYKEHFIDTPDEGKTTYDLKRYNEWFELLKTHLIEYLQTEMQRHHIIKLPAVQKVVTDNTLVVNFNYTDTAEAYFKHIIYVHGSLTEGNIVLGYDPVTPYCLAQYDETQWSKEICREKLAFLRFIEPLKTKYGEEACAELCAGYEKLAGMQNSPRGFEEDDISGWQHENVYREFLDRYGNRKGFNEYDLGAVQEIFVLGHSIQSDKEFLKSILEKCTDIKLVNIFTYEGESNAKLVQKKEFFKSYCKNVITTEYS